jgi:high-affinity nickel-transport protein
MFTAGMVLMDTADSAVMTGAYGWALREPGRRLGYNMAVTALSVLVAVGVGGFELVGLLAAHAGSAIGHAPFGTRMLNAMDLAGPFAGFVVVAVLLLLWGGAALALRLWPKVAE